LTQKRVTSNSENSMEFQSLGFPELKYQEVILPDVSLEVCHRNTGGNVYIWNSFALSDMPAAWAACFYTEDWRFSRLLKEVKAAQLYLTKFQYIFQPDFSVYYDQPLIDQWWRTWLGKNIASVWQKNNFKIIPSLVFGSADNFTAAVYGIPKHQVFCAQLQANDHNKEQDRVDADTLRNAIRLIDPPFCLVYSTQDRLRKLGLDNEPKIRLIRTHINALRKMNKVV